MGCILAWRKLCVHSRYWLRRINGMVYIIKSSSWKKMKILSIFQTRNGGRINTQRDWNYFKARPYPYILKQWCRHKMKNSQKIYFYAQGGNSTGPHYHPPTSKQNFQRNLTMECNGRSENMVYPWIRKITPYHLDMMWWLLMWGLMQMNFIII